MMPGGCNPACYVRLQQPCPAQPGEVWSRRGSPHLVPTDDLGVFTLGFKASTLSDCVAATSVEEHHNAIHYDDPMFSVPMTSQDFIDELS
jgi:hypothetical protein